MVMNHKKNIPKTVLQRMYVDEKMSMKQIADVFRCDAVTIKNRLTEYGIKPRTLSESLRGREITWKDKIGAKSLGRKHSDDTKRLLSEKAIGRPCKFKGMRKFTHPEEITYGSPGEKHWNWKGGVSSVRARIRQSSEYKSWRDSVFRRDNWICQKCGRRGGRLEADHIKSFAKFKKLRFDVDNGRTLCYSCHRESTRRREYLG